MDYSEDGISYDMNGNLKTYNRKGLLLGSSSYIDKLTYSYASSNASNRLSRVDETAGGTMGGWEILRMAAMLRARVIILQQWQSYHRL